MAQSPQDFLSRISERIRFSISTVKTMLCFLGPRNNDTTAKDGQDGMVRGLLDNESNASDIDQCPSNYPRDASVPRLVLPINPTDLHEMSNPQLPSSNTTPFSGNSDPLSSHNRQTSISIPAEGYLSSVKSLQDELYDARIEWPEGGNTYFIPLDDLQRLITVNSIRHELPEESWQFCEQILESVQKLFAILVCLGKSNCIRDFLDEKISDCDLPFERFSLGEGGKSFMLRSHRHSEPLVCMQAWRRVDIESFSRDQWWVLAPVFKETQEVEHHELPDNCVLPFIKDLERDHDHANHGGYGSVWGVIIHPMHQNIYKKPNNPEPLIAIKRLHSTRKADFDSEVEMLKYFCNHQYCHLVKLLATFYWRGKYHLVFPYAKRNLRQYWKETHTPEFSKETVLWSLYQCKGLAFGLHKIHEYRLSQNNNGASSLAPDLEPLIRRTSSPSNRDKEGLYGRHGDIKPENILWTDDEIDGHDGDHSVLNEQGLLLIADFGLMDFHRSKTRSQVSPSAITGSASYEPPERRLHGRISRAFDIWSLGCVYLEFLTWLIGGWDELSNFGDFRCLTGEVNDDTFFTIHERLHGSGDTGHWAEVRDAVVQWMGELQKKPRCSRFIQEFLRLIKEQMLVIEPTKRIQCGALNTELSNMIRKAKEEDKAYLIESRQHCAERPTSPLPEEGTPLPKRGSITHNLHSLTHMSPPSGVYRSHRSTKSWSVPAPIDEPEYSQVLERTFSIPR